MPIHKKITTGNVWKTSALSRNYQSVAKSLIKCSCLFTKNSLISQNKSGFKPGKSCVDQFFSISYEVYILFGDGFHVRLVFLDTSKVFDSMA